MAALSRWDWKLISERTNAAARTLKKVGRCLSRPSAYRFARSAGDSASHSSTEGSSFGAASSVAVSASAGLCHRAAARSPRGASPLDS
jgi:hypothetical protein